MDLQFYYSQARIFSFEKLLNEAIFFLHLQFVKFYFMDVNVYSEIGKLQGVILHRPGIELERMTPENIQEALYSDILSQEVAQKDYASFEGVLKKCTRVFYVQELLESILKQEDVRREIITGTCRMHGVSLNGALSDMDDAALAHTLIEGYEMSDSRNGRNYPIPPLYNFYFTRDASVSVYDQAMINSMRHPVRARESYIMEQIFRHAFHATTFRTEAPSHYMEGGDVLIAREDVLLIGNGDRTSREAIEDLVRRFSSAGKKQYIVVQELPLKPESFIHLDMVFTFLDRNACACYAPLIAQTSTYHTTIICIEGKKISRTEKPTLLDALKSLGFDLEPVSCGHPDDLWNQQREQWHSGANFFAIAPGKVIGYARNRQTIAQLEHHGFDVVPAADIVSGKDDMEKHRRCVITLDSNELPRGGGGGRCMTMPVNREKIIW